MAYNGMIDSRPCRRKPDGKPRFDPTFPITYLKNKQLTSKSAMTLDQTEGWSTIKSWMCMYRCHVNPPELLKTGQKSLACMLNRTPDLQMDSKRKGVT